MRKSKGTAIMLAAVLTATSSGLYFSGFKANYQAHAEVAQLTFDETTSAIEDILAERPDSSSPANLAYNSETGCYRDGVYTVPVYAYAHMQTSESGTDPSMANAALKHEAVITIKDGIASITLSFNAITLDLGNGEIQGHLCDLWYYDVSGKKQEITNKVLDYAYENGDISKPYSIIDTATFSLNSCTNQYYDDAQQKPIFPSDIVCRVDVDAMGDVQQDCNIVIDWKNLQCSYWEKVSAYLDECNSISNDNEKYTVDSYSAFVSTVTDIEGSTTKYDLGDAKNSLIKLQKAKNNLVVVDDVLEDGIYMAKVKYYYVSSVPLTYDDGTAFATIYTISDEKAAFMSEFLGDTVDVTAKNGVYSLVFTPIVDSTSEYYIASIAGAGTSTGNCIWAAKGLKSNGTTTIEYGNTTKKIVTSSSYVSSSVKNRYGADSLVASVSTYPVDASSTVATKNFIAIDIDWDNIEYISALPTDKSALETQIGSTNNLINKNLLTAYIDSSVNNLKAVLADAEAVNNSDTSTQTEIDEALANLKAATNALIKKPTLDGYIGVLSDNIGLTFQIQMAAPLVESNPAVQLEIADETVDTEITVISTDSGTGVSTCKFTAYLDAKQMTDVVTANIIVGDETVATFTGCVKDYADTIIANANSSYSDEAIAAAKAMLNYGGYSQVLFDYNTDSLANASIDTDVSSVTADSLASYKPTKTGSDDTAKFTGYNLYLNSLTSMRFYYTGNVDASATAENYTTGKSGSKNYVEITDITPANFLNGYDVTIGGMTIHASPASYAHTALTKSSDENLQNAMKALIIYSQAATAYDTAK